MAASNSKSLLRVYEKAEGIFQRLAALVVSPEKPQLVAFGRPAFFRQNVLLLAHRKWPYKLLVRSALHLVVPVDAQSASFSAPRSG